MGYPILIRRAVRGQVKPHDDVSFRTLLPALHRDCETAGQIGDGPGRELFASIGPTIRNAVDLEEHPSHGALDREVDILRNRSGSSRDAEGVEPETTTPMTLPDSSSKGPPLLPGWTGAVIWKRVESSRRPASALMFPLVTCRSLASSPPNG